MAELVIKGGRVIDASGERIADVAISLGVVEAVEPDLDPGAALVLDAGGCVVSPGFVDLHTHLREPGGEDAETIESGTRAAVLGGFTAVVAMPNTEPTIDSVEVVDWVAGQEALCHVACSAAITVGRAGEALSPMAELVQAGVRIFTDDGCGVQDDRLMRRAMEYATGLWSGVTLAQHCEVEALAAGGHMHEGEWSSLLGIPGIPAAAEDLMVQRDLALAALTGATVHFQHLSTATAVQLVRQAKASGLAVSAEATTHHFTLTHAEVAGYDPVFKVNPPLRTPEDVAAIRQGLADGTIDAIATDHAPHTAHAKDAPFDQALPGMLGLETALALAVTELVTGAGMALADVLALMSWRPAAIAGLAPWHGGQVVAGASANLTVFDPAQRWTVDPSAGASLSRNTPYAGRTLTGRVRHTIVDGEAVVIDGVAQR